MKFAFFASNLVPFHANTLNERALGGTETGVIRLTEALTALGHDVTVYTPLENPPPSNPLYKYQREIENSPPVDAYISIRDWIPAFYKIEAKKRFLWTGDAYDQFSNFGLGDRRVALRLDGVLTVSDWQSKTLSEASGCPFQKMKVIRNGIDLKLFEGKEKRIRKRLIYSSTPHRGLVHLPLLFTELQKKHPELELHIFSGYKIYDQKEENFREVFEVLKKMKGVSVHESILQKDLAREMMRSSILFYPCHFEETSCITAMEAQAAGCVVLSTKLGALTETVGNAGILLDGLPGKENYYQEYLKAADRLLSDDDFFESYSRKAQEQAQTFSWRTVAERLVGLLEKELK